MMRYSFSTQIRVAMTITTMAAAPACVYSFALGQEPPPPPAIKPGASSSVNANGPMPSPSGKANADAIGMGLKHFRKQEWTLAIEHFTAAIKQSPQDPSGYWFRAQSRERLGNAAEARDDYGAVVRLVEAPTEVPALRARGFAFIQLGKYDDAAADLRAALTLNANDTESLMFLGQVCELRKELDSAVELYTRLIKVAPKSADAVLRRGNAYVQLGKTREGMADQKRAVRLGGITSGEFIYKDQDSGTLYRFVFVPPARYWVGYDEEQRTRVAGQSRQLLFGHNATPIQQVRLQQGFFILDRETTVEQFDAPLKGMSSKQPNPSTRNAEADLRLGVPPEDAAHDTPTQKSGSNLPRTDVSWVEAMKFCLAMQEQIGLIVRLPTEIEWECAARYQRSWLYPWGPTVGDDFPAWSGRENGGPRPLNQSDNEDVTPSGIHDLGGNISEWCLDEYQNSLLGESTEEHLYMPSKFSLESRSRNKARKSRRASVPVDVFQVFDKSRRSFRGGSFEDNEFNCQVPVRRAMLASESSSAIGFRPVLLMRFPR